MSELKNKVKEFWEKNPCGTSVARSDKFTLEYFKEIENYRYSVEPFILEFAEFDKWNNRKVLEVGIGAGTDNIQFAKNGAKIIGVDLTFASIQLAKKRYELEGFEYRLCQCDAENLPFKDNTFDYVYSWGVLHHTPDTQRGIEEVYRVLKPDGKICIMLYHRYSIAFFKLYFKCAFLKFKPFQSLKNVIFYNMESIGTKAYSIKEVKYLFKKFKNVKITPVLTFYDKNRIPKSFQRFIPTTLGSFLIIKGEKNIFKD